jgi:hypothetical protein
MFLVRSFFRSIAEIFEQSSKGAAEILLQTDAEERGG